VVALDEIRSRLARYEPRTLDPVRAKRAAVSVVLRDAGAGPELLFIERAKRAGDPWSGHMAFPGGRMEPGDASPQAAAERETHEEVGLVLAGAEHLGRLDDLEGRHAGRPVELVISAFVYRVGEVGPLVPSEEVEEAMWVPLRTLADPTRHVDYAYPPARGAVYPGIVVGHPERHVVWGLTFRFLEGFFAALGRPLVHEGRVRVGA